VISCIVPACRTYHHDLLVAGYSSHNVFSNGSGTDLCLDHHGGAPHNNLWTDIDLVSNQYVRYCRSMPLVHVLSRGSHAPEYGCLLGLIRRCATKHIQWTLTWRVLHCFRQGYCVSRSDLQSHMRYHYTACIIHCCYVPLHVLALRITAIHMHTPALLSILCTDAAPSACRLHK
jgi:hypothetical protein